MRGGGGEFRLEFFRKFVHYGTVTRPNRELICSSTLERKETYIQVVEKSHIERERLPSLNGVGET